MWVIVIGAFGISLLNFALAISLANRLAKVESMLERVRLWIYRDQR